ncbi:MAG: insulinase family protein [Bdellovibrionales bacterium]|nr:insulinase family protein [Bdellovibrionales bacterium]
MAHTPNALRPEELTLSNGIPVILQPLDGPVAALYWWNQTGSVHEHKGEEGFAHFLEHMLFKDTDAKSTGRASSGATARAIEGFGGDINAYTSFEQTVYHVTCAEQHWEKIIQVFGTMAKPQRFLKGDFEREREVILEELRKTEDSPSRQGFQTLFSTVYSRHPYGRPVIGFAKTLKAATLAKLEAFYRRRYVPERMGLIVVGPLDAAGKRKKEVMKLLERFYGASVMKAGTVKEKAGWKIPQEPALRKGVTTKGRKFDVETPSVSMAFRVPNLMDPVIPALELASGALGSGESSRLYQSLFYGKSLVTDISAGVYVPSDPGMAYVDLDVAKLEQVAPSVEIALAELARMRVEGPNEAETERVITNIESEKLYSAQTADGVAGRLGFLKFVLGDLNFDQKYIEDLKAVTKEQVQAAASQYFAPQRMALTLLYPKKGPDYDLAPLAKKAEKALAPLAPAGKGAVLLSGAKAPAKKGPSTPDTVFTTASGLRVAYQYRPQSHAFSLHASVPGGTRLELGHSLFSADRDWGASHLLAQTWAKGTPGRTARDIAAFVEGKAAMLDGFSGRNTVGLEMTGLSRDWKSLSPLFTEVLLTPSFPDDEIEHSRRVTEDSIKGIQDHSGQLCSVLFQQTLFEKHPYGRITLGSEESVKALKRDTLAAYHRHWVRTSRMALSAVGSVPEREFRAWLEDLEARAKALGGAAGRPPAQDEHLEDEPVLKAPRWIHRQLGREQSHILVGGLGLTLTSDERHAFRLLHTLLSGQSGRLFIELREKRSLAYTVSPTGFEGLERGTVGTYIACATSKVEEAVKGMSAVLTQLAKKGPSEAEMKRAREFHLGRRAMDLQSDSSLANYYGLELQYQGKVRTEEEAREQVLRLTAKDLARVCEKYYVEPYMVTAIVG